MEEMTILITNEAKRELDKLLANSDKTCIRILTRCITMTSEAKLDFELDEPNANDNLYDVDGYKVIINKVLDSQMNYLMEKLDEEILSLFDVVITRIINDETKEVYKIEKNKDLTITQLALLCDENNLEYGYKYIEKYNCIMLNKNKF